MSNTSQPALTSYIERARKVLQHEQRTHHQDQAIKPGGLEIFVGRWADVMSSIYKDSGLDLGPIYHFTECLEGYRKQDPMQRAASLRAALAILNELGTVSESPPPAATMLHSGSTRASTQAEKPAGTNLLTAAPGNSDDRDAPGQTETRTAVHQRICLEAGTTPGHTAALTLLSADITSVPHVGAAGAARLHNLGICTVRDLLFYLPRDHRDYSKLEKIANLPFNELTTTRGLVWEVKNAPTRGGRQRTLATISDETGKLNVTWFNQPYLLKQLKAAQGTWLVVTGTKQRFGNKIEFSVRSHELPEEGDLLHTGRLVPIYALTEGLHAKALRRYTKWVVDHYAALVPDYLPASVRQSSQLMPLPSALAHIHYPDDEASLAAARRRLAFDELFFIQLGMQERRTRWQREAPAGNAFKVDLSKVFIDVPPQAGQAGTLQEAEEREDSSQPFKHTLWAPVIVSKPFEASLPFRFTAAQRRVICEILADLAQSQPMCRLLQGDVGAGKTAVAAAALLTAALSGYQGAIMAPTELLAEQHARSIDAMLEPFGIRSVLLTGSLKQRERTLGRSAIENGEAMVAIGTHALIQEDVNFQRLGLVIVDEQHRFGVEQRDALRQKGYHPHMLVMTATPIPRTLALTLYGDLDVSVIDQLPPGRQQIITRRRTGARRAEAHTLIAQEVAQGHQAFIIYPLIEESESLAVKAATVEYARLSREFFPNLRLGLLHGAMKPAEKDTTMRRFRDHALDILVATSLIEVGIDLPNATVMVIEDADRFGLSQLHQFRGRVGRGQYQSYCYVLSAAASLQAQERLEVFQSTSDGFRLAEEDMRLRGPGDFIGVRQSGMPALRMADLNDARLIEESRRLAARLWQSDPYLRKPEHAALRERMHLFWQNFTAH